MAVSVLTDDRLKPPDWVGWASVGLPTFFNFNQKLVGNEKPVAHPT
jgi:hypothetical protein